jgi:hypothetical protein
MEPNLIFEPQLKVLQFEKNVLELVPKGKKIGKMGCKPPPKEPSNQFYYVNTKTKYSFQKEELCNTS